MSGNPTNQALVKHEVVLLDYDFSFGQPIAHNR